MSWDIYLIDDRGHTEIDQNYTHNCNDMLAEALVDAGFSRPKRSWYQYLDGMTGIEGKRYLSIIIQALTVHPARYIAMNPLNGWGDYTSLVGVLRKLRNAVPLWPTEWSASG
jgi:hypothetical protein